jgi:selenide,water dikinase
MCAGWNYVDKIGSIANYQKLILADPQTSGGLLIAVSPEVVSEVKNLFVQQGLNKFINPIGKFIAKEEKVITIK